VTVVDTDASSLRVVATPRRRRGSLETKTSLECWEMQVRDWNLDEGNMEQRTVPLGMSTAREIGDAEGRRNILLVLDGPGGTGVHSYP